jgi:hypothetical protein
MKVVGCQPYAPAAFTLRINLALIFRGWVDPRAHGTVRLHGKSPGDAGNRSRDLLTCSSLRYPTPHIYIANKMTKSQIKHYIISVYNNNSNKNNTNKIHESEIRFCTTNSHVLRFLNRTLWCTSVIRTKHVPPATRLLIQMHQRNIIKLHVQVFLKMNTWMFETCRRHYN